MQINKRLKNVLLFNFLILMLYYFVFGPHTSTVRFLVCAIGSGNCHSFMTVTFMVFLSEYMKRDK